MKTNETPNNRRILSVLIFTILFILSSGFYSYPSRKKTQTKKADYIEIWHSFSQSKKELLNSQIERYNNLNQSIKVKSVFKGKPEDLYLDLLARENLPSIAIVPTFYLKVLAEMDLIIDLGGYLPSKLKKDIPEKFWDSVTVNGKIYGLPFIYTFPVFFINQNIIQSRGIPYTEEPANWDQIFNTLKRIKETTDKYGVYIPTDSLYDYIEYVESYTDKKVYFKDRIDISSDSAIEAMDFLQKAIYELRYMPEKLTPEEAQNMFFSGKLAIILSDASNLVNFKSTIPYILGVWPLPFGKNTRPMLIGTSFVIINSSKRYENESYKVLEYLLKYENILRWYTHTGAPPIRNSIKESLELLVFYEENPNHLIITNEAEKADVFNPDFDYISYNKIVKKAIEEIIINEKSPSLIMKKAQSELEALQK